MSMLRIYCNTIPGYNFLPTLIQVDYMAGYLIEIPTEKPRPDDNTLLKVAIMNTLLYTTADINMRVFSVFF